MDKIWREKAEEETHLVSATKLIGLVGAGCLVEELFVVHSPAWSLGFLPSWLEDVPGMAEVFGHVLGLKALH